jgi:hypothetical protein
MPGKNNVFNYVSEMVDIPKHTVYNSPVKPQIYHSCTTIQWIAVDFFSLKALINSGVAQDVFLQKPSSATYL